MKLTLEAENEVAELRKMMNYINSFSYTEEKFSGIEFGNLNPENKKTPILICTGNCRVRITNNLLCNVELARNHLDPRGVTKGTYFTIALPFGSTGDIFTPQIERVVKARQLQRSKNIFYNLGLWQYHPVTDEREIEILYSTVKDFVRLNSNPKIRELEIKLKEELIELLI